MRKIIFFYLVLLAFTGSVFAQNTLLLNNGKKIDIWEFRNVVNSNNIEFIQYKTFKGWKDKVVEKSDVFSITEKGFEKIIYTPNYGIGDSLSIQEMKSVVYGQLHARESKISFFDKKNIVPPESYLNDPNYLLGHQIVEKDKQMKRVVIGTLVGTFAGILTAYVCSTHANGIAHNRGK